MDIGVKIYIEIIEACISCFYMSSLFQSNKSVIKRFLWFFLLYGLNLIVYLVPQTFPFVNVASYFLVNAILIKKCYENLKVV